MLMDAALLFMALNVVFARRPQNPPAAGRLTSP
jgi:hypothetical protein